MKKVFLFLSVLAAQLFGHSEILIDLKYATENNFTKDHGKAWIFWFANRMVAF